MVLFREIFSLRLCLHYHIAGAEGPKAEDVGFRFCVFSLNCLTLISIQYASLKTTGWSPVKLAGQVNFSSDIYTVQVYYMYISSRSNEFS